MAIEKSIFKIYLKLLAVPGLDFINDTVIEDQGLHEISSVL